MDSDSVRVITPDRLDAPNITLLRADAEHLRDLLVEMLGPPADLKAAR